MSYAKIFLIGLAPIGRGLDRNRDDRMMAPRLLHQGGEPHEGAGGARAGGL